MRSWIVAVAAALCVAGQGYGEEAVSKSSLLDQRSLGVLQAKDSNDDHADLDDFVVTYATGSKTVSNNGTVVCNMQDSLTPDVGNAISVDRTHGIYTINKSGYYSISFGCAPKTGRARFAITRNNVPVTAAMTGCLNATGGQMISGNTILWLARNTQLKLVNLSGASVVLESGGSPSDPCAYVNIMQLRTHR